MTVVRSPASRTVSLGFAPLAGVNFDSICMSVQEESRPGKAAVLNIYADLKVLLNLRISRTLLGVDCVALPGSVDVEET